MRRRKSLSPPQAILFNRKQARLEFLIFFSNFAWNMLSSLCFTVVYALVRHRRTGKGWILSTFCEYLSCLPVGHVLANTKWPSLEFQSRTSDIVKCDFESLVLSILLHYITCRAYINLKRLILKILRSEKQIQQQKQYKSKQRGRTGKYWVWWVRRLALKPNCILSGGKCNSWPFNYSPRILKSFLASR